MDFWTTMFDAMEAAETQRDVSIEFASMTLSLLTRQKGGC